MDSYLDLSLTLIFIHIKPDEKHLFSAVEQPAQNWECVLIYDEETGVCPQSINSVTSYPCSKVYTLEVLDSSLDIQYDTRATSKVEYGQSHFFIQVAGILNLIANTALNDADAEGLIQEQIMRDDIPREYASVTPQEPQAKPTKAKKPQAEAKQSKANLLPARSALKGKSKNSSSVQLALPKSSSDAHSVAGFQFESTSSVSAGPLLVYEGSSEGSVLHSDMDDEDMEPVHVVDEDEEQGEEVDEDALAAELNDIMEEESTIYRVEDESNARSSGPVSLNQYAGGNLLFDRFSSHSHIISGLYDDDSSSSEDSEG